MSYIPIKELVFRKENPLCPYCEDITAQISLPYFRVVKGEHRRLVDFICRQGHEFTI